MADNPQIFDIPIGNVVGPKGDTGNGISSIELLETVGLSKTYRITMTDETYFDFIVTDGNGISGVSYNPETYTLTLTFDDGTSFTTGSLRGAPGQRGDDGYSPTITITTITGGHRVTITDADHPTGQSFDVMDGASDAGQVAYDETEDYPDGSIGAEVSQQKNDIDQKQDAPSSAGTAGQVLGLDSNLDPVWVNQSGGSTQQMELIKFVTLENDAQAVVIDTDDRSEPFVLNNFVIIIKSVGAVGATSEGFLKIALNSDRHSTNRIADITGGIKKENNMVSVCGVSFNFTSGCCGYFIRSGANVISDDGTVNGNAYGDTPMAFVSGQSDIEKVFVGSDSASHVLGAGSIIALYGQRK